MLYLWGHQHSQGCAEGLVLNKTGQWLCLVVRENVEAGLTQKKVLVMVFPLEAESTEIEYNVIALQQRKCQTCSSSPWLQVIVGPLREESERRPLPPEMDVSVGRREGQDGPTFGSPRAMINWGAPEWGAPCAHTISSGQKQAVSATGSMITGVGTLCYLSAVIHALVQLCLKEKG